MSEVRTVVVAERFGLGKTFPDRVQAPEAGQAEKKGEAVRLHHAFGVIFR